MIDSIAYGKKKLEIESSLAVQWLGLGAFTAGGLDSVPALRTEIPYPMQCLCSWSCATLCDPLDCSPLGSCVHGVFQAGVLEQVAISSSRGSF